MDGGAWWAAVHGVSKSQTRLSDFTFTLHFYALEKEMATHSSFLPGESQGRGRTESDTTEVTWQQHGSKMTRGRGKIQEKVEQKWVKQLAFCLS